MSDGSVEVRIGRDHYRTEVDASGRTMVVDEPVEAGGTDAGPNPYDLLLGSIGACTAITLRMYADRKGWALERVTVRLRQARSHARDCADCPTKHVGLNQVERELELDGDLTADQRERLLQIADRCPVGQTLQRGIQVVAAQPV